MTTVDFEKGREFHDFEDLTRISTFTNTDVLKPSTPLAGVVQRKLRGESVDGEEQGAKESAL